MEDDSRCSIGTDQSTLSAEPGCDAGDAKDGGPIGRQRGTDLSEMDGIPSDFQNREKASEAGLPPPPPPPSVVGDRRCPIHSLLLRHESERSTSTVQTSNSLSSSLVDSDPPVKCTAATESQDPPQTNRPPKHLPPTRKHDSKTSTIRQHYYPEGGWGWLVCACAFMIQVLTTGMQFAYGILYLEVSVRYESEDVLEAGWLGALSFAVSFFLAPFVVALCRRKSTRLTAVFGGLVMALACLFTSFAHRLHQIFVSYGIVLGLGVGLTREAANLMIGQYFKRRREFVEILVQAGSGIGTSLFSVFFKEAISTIGWRLGLQAVTGVLFLTFILGILYRSASLYHPQRRAILHLKNQKKKVKEKNRTEDKPPYFDFGTIKTRTLQVIMLSSAVAALGIYSPIFYLALHCKHEGLDSGSILLLQTFIGLAFTIGNISFGLVVVRQNDQCLIARQYLCQAALCGLGMAIMALGSIQGYHGYVLFAWMYGIFLGGYHFSLKVYTLEKVRARNFARAWGFVECAKSLPILFGVPITGYINQGHNSKSGFYFACAFTFLGASCLFLMNLHSQRLRKKDHTVTFSTVESHVLPQLDYFHSDGAACPDTVPRLGRMGKSASFATSVDVGDSDKPNYMTGISEERMGESVPFDDYYACECITSCDKVENALLFSEYENNLNTNSAPAAVSLDAESSFKHGNIVYAALGHIEEDDISDRRTNVEGRGGAAADEESDAVTPMTALENGQRAALLQNTSFKPRCCSITVVEEMTTSV